MAKRTVIMRVEVDVPDRDEDALLAWARSTYDRPDFTLEDAYQALARETLFLGERYAHDDAELEDIAFSITTDDD